MFAPNLTQILRQISTRSAVSRKSSNLGPLDDSDAVLRSTGKPASAIEATLFGTGQESQARRPRFM